LPGTREDLKIMNVQTGALTSAQLEYSIHPATSLGYVSLTVANLDNQIVFYQQALGLSLHWRKGNNAGLGAGNADLLQLVEQANVKRYRHVTGMYHFAVVFPDRRELARAVARLSAQKVRNYPTDHVMTKSTYLNDPEGNGIELYAESPEDGMFLFENGDFVTRRTNGSLSDGREPLDLDALFSHLLPDDRLDGAISPSAHLGHMHLHVRDVDEAVAFYHGVLVMSSNIISILLHYCGAEESEGKI
jgi:catechol 2,3-dioxygenase